MHTTVTHPPPIRIAIGDEPRPDRQRPTDHLRDVVPEDRPAGARRVSWAVGEWGRPWAWRPPYQQNGGSHAGNGGSDSTAKGPANFASPFQ